MREPSLACIGSGSNPKDCRDTKQGRQLTGDESPVKANIPYPCINVVWRIVAPRRAAKAWRQIMWGRCMGKMARMKDLSYSARSVCVGSL
jgi:hypothetical protein